jgi:Arc/MetJ-type ribon-helix-helix transcriptional regulator
MSTTSLNARHAALWRAIAPKIGSAVPELPAARLTVAKAAAAGPEARNRRREELGKAVPLAGNHGEVNKRGRPATGRDALVGVRMEPSLIADIDDWAASQPEPRSSRSEAVRRLVESALDQVAMMERAVQFAAVLLNGGRIAKEAASEGQAPRVSPRTRHGKDFVLTDGLITTRFPASLLEGLLESPQRATKARSCIAHGRRKANAGPMESPPSRPGRVRLIRGFSLARVRRSKPPASSSSRRAARGRA